ncbi:hypothetical protein [Natrarchaeobaculum sulfurireducens]|uniref:Envelope protein N-terminal domain-containing protein n=1 Tax=Natrarchaeobaculum sulfurireducens TaxID=2044521 RepID=A0A346PDV1_9EURY|nr:hypothetical protein [Natrarchaeobaculum sulfurireducens]AXR77696.1 hypothetical protein AArc1_1361 [Natrarchaeobaculum sulfurireducens]
MTDSDSSTDDSSCSRRGYLKRIGASAGAVGAIGAGASATDNGPVGNAEAVAPIVVAGGAAAAGTAAGGAAGYALAEYRSSEPNIDSTSVTEDRIYQAVSSAHEAGSSFIDEAEREFLDASETPFERTAWSNISTRTAGDAAEGEETGTTMADAQRELNETVTTSMTNLVESWNTFINSIIEEIVLDSEETGSLDISVWERYVRNASGPHSDSEGGTPQPVKPEDVDDEWVPIEASQPDGEDGYIVYMVPVETPVDASELNGRDDDLYVAAVMRNDEHWHHPFEEWAPVERPGSFDMTGTFDRREVRFRIQHSDWDTIDPLGHWKKMRDVHEQIEDDYDEINGKLDDYVDTVHDGIETGAVDPDDLISSSDIATQFADSSEQSRFEAELLAIGANVPDESGYTALVKHSELGAEPVWGRLYPQFEDGETMQVAPGVELGEDDYRMAYFGYLEEDEDGYETVVLPGDEPLKIKEVDGLESVDADLDYSTVEAGEDGRVTVYEGDDPPEQIEEKDDAYGVMIEGEDNETWVSLADLELAEADDDEDDDEDDDSQEYDVYYVEETELEEGEKIESMEIVPSVNYTQHIDSVADPTEIDTDETLEQIDALRDQTEELEEALGDAGGSSGGDGGGGIDDTLVFGGLAALVLSTLAAVFMGDS